MPTECHVCKRKFNRKKEMLMHAKIHTASEVFTCKICQEQFINIKDHDQHVLHHKPKTPVCHICHKKWPDYGKLARHLKVHTGEKPFICYICERAFNRKSSLVRHELIHKGDKPFTCSICYRGYASLEELQKHLELHDDEGFDCEVCGKSFVDKSKLQRHSLTHTDERPEVCDICQKSFKQSSTLERHYMTHMEGKEYACDVCDHAFTTKNQLFQHYAIHKARNDFNCEYCDKSFPLERKLQVHVKSFHAELFLKKRNILPNVMLERVVVVNMNIDTNPTPKINPNISNKTDLTDDFANAFLVPLNKMNEEVNKVSEKVISNSVPDIQLSLEEAISMSLQKESCSYMTDGGMNYNLDTLSNISMENSAALNNIGDMNDLEDILIIPQENNFPINDSAEVV